MQSMRWMGVLVAVSSALTTPSASRASVVENTQAPPAKPSATAAPAKPSATAAPAKPSATAASPPEIDPATRSFDEGTALYEQSRWSEAEAAFQRAWDLKPTHDIAANLGDCELRIGQLREAAEHLQFAATTFPLSGDAALKRRLEVRLEEAKREVATVRVRVNMAGATVVAGGRRVGYSPLQQPVFLEPGEAMLEVSLAGHTTHRTTLALEKGTDREVSVELAPIEEPAGRSWLPVYLGAGVTAVALGTGITLLAMSNNAFSEAEEQGASLDRAGAECPSRTYGAQCDELLRTLERRDALGNAAIGAFVVSGAALVGTVAYAVWPRKRPATTGVQVRPVFGLGAGGVLATGSF